MLLRASTNMVTSSKWVKVGYWMNYPFNPNSHSNLGMSESPNFPLCFAVDLGGHLYFEFFAYDVGSYSTRREPK